MDAERKAHTEITENTEIIFVFIREIRVRKNPSNPSNLPLAA